MATRAEKDLWRSAEGPTRHRAQPAVLADFWQAIDETKRAHDISIFGVSTMRQAVILERVNLGLDPHGVDVPPAHAAALQAAHERAAMAIHEEGREFAAINGTGAVALWGSLEALVERTVRSKWDYTPVVAAAQLVRRVNETNPELTQKLLDLHGSEVFDALQKALGEEVRERLRSHPTTRALRRKSLAGTGADRFEYGLRLVGLGGDDEDMTDRYLTELQAVRDALAHRAGRVDDRFLSMCDWLGYEEGDLLRITVRQFESYFEVVRHYGYEVGRRLMRLAGIELEPSVLGPLI